MASISRLLWCRHPGACSAAITLQEVLRGSSDETLRIYSQALFVNVRLTSIQKEGGEPSSGRSATPSREVAKTNAGAGALLSRGFADGGRSARSGDLV